MLVVLGVFFVLFVLRAVPVCFFLHAFLVFFFLQLLFQDLHQTEGCAGILMVDRQGVFHPLVGFPAHIEKQVAGCDGCDVRNGRLITVQIHAGASQQHQLAFLCCVAQDLLRPVADGIGRADDLRTVSGLVRVIRRCIPGRAGAEAEEHDGCQQERAQFLHGLPPCRAFLAQAVEDRAQRIQRKMVLFL